MDTFLYGKRHNAFYIRQPVSSCVSHESFEKDYDFFISSLNFLCRIDTVNESNSTKTTELLKILLLLEWKAQKRYMHQLIAKPEHTCSQNQNQDRRVKGNPTFNESNKYPLEAGEISLLPLKAILSSALACITNYRSNAVSLATAPLVSPQDGFQASL